MIAPEPELRFHVMRLGSRKLAARLYGVSCDRYYKDLPTTDFDRYRRGEMVMIGNILAKKCLVCGTARELQHYWANPSARSGCRETCEFCRRKAREALYLG